MPTNTRPVLSVIVRRFQKDSEGDIERSVTAIQRAVADQPGFAGLQNSVSRGTDFCELVTVFAFNSRRDPERWESSEARKNFVKELDTHSHDTATHIRFGDLALLLHPSAQLKKIETVAVLIFWILVVGSVLRYFADLFLPPSFPGPWQNALLITVNVLLISYVLLPWSSVMVTRLKARILQRKRER